MIRRISFLFLELYYFLAIVLIFSPLLCHSVLFRFLYVSQVVFAVFIVVYMLSVDFVLNVLTILFVIGFYSADNRA